MGAYFLVFIGGTLFVSLTLLFERLDDLRGDNELDSFVSRESAFLLNNLILIGAAFAVFWGTVFPIISEAVRGVKITVGAPFFNQVSLPIFLTLLAVMGVCPLIGWRRASNENLLRNFMIPATLGLISVGFLLWLGIREFLSILPLALCAFTAVTIVLEWIRGVRARHTLRQENYASALLNLVMSNKRRYGGYIVHLGIIMIAVGVVGVYGFKSEKSATLAKDETMKIGDYVLEYKGVSNYSVKSHDVLAASLNVYKGGKLIDRLVPVKNSYPGQEQVSTEVAIRTTLKEDLYVILEDAGTDGSASFKVVINPLVVWLWIGGGVLLLGTVIAFWPEAKVRRRVAVEVELQDSRSLQPVGS